MTSHAMDLIILTDAESGWIVGTPIGIPEELRTRIYTARLNVAAGQAIKVLMTPAEQTKALAALIKRAEVFGYPMPNWDEDKEPFHE